MSLRWASPANVSTDFSRLSTGPFGSGTFIAFAVCISPVPVGMLNYVEPSLMAPFRSYVGCSVLFCAACCRPSLVLRLFVRIPPVRMSPQPVVQTDSIISFTFTMLIVENCLALSIRGIIKWIFCKIRAEAVIAWQVCWNTRAELSFWTNCGTFINSISEIDGVRCDVPMAAPRPCMPHLYKDGQSHGSNGPTL